MGAAVPEHLSCQHCYGTVPYSTQTVAATRRHGKGLSLLPVVFRLGLVGWGGGLSSLQVVGFFLGGGLFVFWFFVVGTT